MYLGSTPVRLGAYLPRVSAPPLPAKLWHMAQLVRKIRLPRETSPPVASYSSGVGIAGPGCRLATYAETWRISSGVSFTGPCGACGPLCWSGMRPVPTWKSTAAAPTPMRDGALLRPSALKPWHVAQFAMNTLRPAATSSETVPEASARPGSRAAYAAPVMTRPRSTRTTVARGWRRLAASAVTMRLSCVGRPAWVRGAGSRCASLDHVDDEEQADPDDVDEVP